MANSIEIGGSPITIGGNTIDLVLPGTDAFQLSVVSPIASGSNSLINKQLAIVSLITLPVDMRAFSLAVVIVMSPNRRVITPNLSIGLDCWQPCLSYGTSALVYWKGN